jgi:hypothetical protein
MHRSVVLLSALSALLMVLIAQGCGAGSCSEANCGGCCDANGRCASGSTPDLCGQAGARCSKCPNGAQCLQQVCTIVQGTGGGSGGGTPMAGGAGGGASGGSTAGGAAGGGVGGGAAGGGVAGGASAGGGSGGGAPAGCTSIDLIENLRIRGGGVGPTSSGQQTGWSTAFWLPASVGSNLTLRIDAYVYRPVGTTPSLPITGTFTAASRFLTCDECLTLATACDLNGNACSGGDLIPRAGSYQFTQVASNALAGSAEHLLFRPWNLTTDAPRTSDSTCIYVRRLEFSATW